MQQREAAREAARQKAAEENQKLFKACVDGYKTSYKRHPKATIVSTVVGGILVLGIGGMWSNSSEPSRQMVAEPLSTPESAHSSSSNTQLPEPVAPSVEAALPKSPTVAKPTPEPTYEQVAAIAYGENCQERLRGMYGFNSPELAARRIYYDWGYTREKIKDLALDDLTKLTAYQLGTGQNEVQVIAQLTEDHNSTTFANIVVGAAKQGYMSQYMENAQRECKDLALSGPQSQVSIGCTDSH